MQIKFDSKTAWAFYDFQYGLFNAGDVKDVSDDRLIKTFPQHFTLVPNSEVVEAIVNSVEPIVETQEVVEVTVEEQKPEYKFNNKKKKTLEVTQDDSAKED